MLVLLLLVAGTLFCFVAPVVKSAGLTRGRKGSQSWDVGVGVRLCARSFSSVPGSRETMSNDLHPYKASYQNDAHCIQRRRANRARQYARAPVGSACVLLPLLLYNLCGRQ